MIRALGAQTIVTTHAPNVASMCMPTDLMVTWSLDGVLSSRNLYSEKIKATDPNWMRSLFGSFRQDLVDSLMHPSLLIPEGIGDRSWLMMLSRTIEANPSDLTDLNGMAFGMNVGIVPTQSAQVVETAKLLCDKHKNIASLVDGDAAGISYVEKLSKLTGSLKLIVRWADNWKMEDFIVWILEHDEDVINSQSIREYGIENNLTKLADRLSDVNGKNGGLKSDKEAHGLICDAIGNSKICRDVTASVLDDLAKLCMGVKDVEYFEKQEQDEGVVVWIFTPKRNP